MYEHKASAHKDGIITPVSRHFKSEGHNHTHMILTHQNLIHPTESGAEGFNYLGYSNCTP